MEIVEQTLHRLKLQSDQKKLALSQIGIGLGSVILGLALMIFGIGSGEGSGTLVRLTCERRHASQDTCQLVSSRLISSTIKEIPFSQIQAASANLEKGKILILTTAGEVVFSDLQAGHKLSPWDQSIINKINYFISNSQVTSLQVQQDNRLLPYLFGGIAVLNASILLYAILFFTELRIICVFDKPSGQMVLQKEALLRRKMIQKQLSEIQTIQLQEHRDEIRGRILSYRICAVFKSGDLIPLGDSISPIYKDHYVEILNCIHDWLGDSKR